MSVFNELSENYVIVPSEQKTEKAEKAEPETAAGTKVKPDLEKDEGNPMRSANEAREAVPSSSKSEVEAPDLSAPALQAAKCLAGRLDELTVCQLVPAGGRLDERDAPVLVNGADDVVRALRCTQAFDQEDIERSLERAGDDLRQGYATVRETEDDRVLGSEVGDQTSELVRCFQTVLEEPHGVPPSGSSSSPF